MKTYFNGMILLASPLVPERILPLTESAFGRNVRITDRLPDGFCLWLLGESRYAEHAVQDFLNAVTPHTRYGDIAFYPDRAQHFRWYYSRASGLWQKQNGTVQYERSGVPLAPGESAQREGGSI